MRVEVEIHTSNLVSVSTYPSWWRWILGARGIDSRMAVRVAGGWCWDVGGADVDGGGEATPISDAIEREFGSLPSAYPQKGTEL